jgi:hypothetical protein
MSRRVERERRGRVVVVRKIRKQVTDDPWRGAEETNELSYELGSVPIFDTERTPTVRGEYTL